MARYQDCPPCQIGDHSNHYRTVRGVPEGMIGGVICICQGECKEDKANRQKQFLDQVWGRNRRRRRL